MTTSSIERAQPGWRFWLVWVFATFAGVVGYVFVIPPILNAVGELLGGVRSQVWIGIAIGAISAVALGATIGAAQWLVLRRQLPRTGWWVLATAIGYSIPLVFGSPMGGLEPPWLAGAAMFLEFGVLLGALQWLVLRGRVERAGWWIAFSVAGWVFAAALIDIAYISGLNVEPFDLFAAFIVPLATAGGGMAWLLRRTASTIPSNDLPR
jgi:hypothetical protein